MDEKEKLFSGGSSRLQGALLSINHRVLLRAETLVPASQGCLRLRAYRFLASEQQPSPPLTPALPVVE